MKVSKAWLQNYIEEKLPSTEEVVKAFTMHAFEVEGTEKVGDDEVIDVKVLPDRAHYALSHYGIASELAVILGLTLKPKNKSILPAASKELKVKVENPTLCRRYIGAVVKGVKVGPSPAWLHKYLVTLGQRSINNVVDATNFVMLSIGQPLHAFDMAKLSSKDGGVLIDVASLQDSQRVALLDGKEYELKAGTLVIKDGNSDKVLAIAGVKGGMHAIVDEATNDIVVESANFDPVATRKTSRSLNLINDSSKRFENEITPELASQGMSDVLALITEIAGGEVEGCVDLYPSPQPVSKVSVSIVQINSVLGSNMTEAETEAIFNKFKFSFEKKNDMYEVTIPAERLDLRIKEDLIEEVGRIYGYDRIETKIPSKGESKLLNKEFAYVQKIKSILVGLGFSEVLTYAFTDKGEVEIANPLASDKGFLRTALTPKIVESLEFNLKNAELLGLDQIKIFEIGKVFKKDSEYNALCIGVANVKGFKNKNLPKDEQTVNGEIRAAREMLWEKLDANIQTLCTIDDTGGIIVAKGKAIGVINNTDGVMELNLDALIAVLPELGAAADISSPAGGQRGNASEETSATTPKFQAYSAYPFIVRDIAVFVPGEQSDESKNKILEIIKDEGTDLLIKWRLFDVFTRPPKPEEAGLVGGQARTSYAFHLVFQSMERTLTDDETNKIMEKMAAKMNSNEGWQVR
jgi:phenylalanyl-tRNA synthetase beta chain